MSYSNDQISKPVTIDDLQQAVGSGSTDLATTITDGATLFSSTARWNLHKPTKGSSKLFNLTDAEFYALDCGLNVPTNTVPIAAIIVVTDASSGGGAYIEYEDGAGSAKLCDVAVKWTYKGVPTGGASDPYRISDFADVTNNVTGFQTEPSAPLKITVETVKGEINFVDTDDPDQRPRLVYTIDASIGVMILKQLQSLNYISSAQYDAGFIIVGENPMLFDPSDTQTVQGNRLYGIENGSYIFPLSDIPSTSPWEYEIYRAFYRIDKTSGSTFKTALCIGVGLDTSGYPKVIVPLDSDFFAEGSQAYNTIKPEEKSQLPYQIDVDCYGFVHYDDGHRYIYFKGSIWNRSGVSLAGVKYYMRLDYSQTSTTGTKSSEMRTSEVSLNFEINETKLVYPTTLETGSLVASLTYVSYIDPTDPTGQTIEYFVRCEDPITPSQTVDDGPAYHWISIYMNDHGYKNSKQVQIMSYDEYWGLV